VTFACYDMSMETTLRTVTEAAKQLGITPGAVRDAIAKGKIVPVRLGGGGQRAGMLLVPEDQITAYERNYKGKRGTYTRRHTAKSESAQGGSSTDQSGR
jgi:excisionase family DNA binding protein